MSYFKHPSSVRQNTPTGQHPGSVLSHPGDPLEHPGAFEATALSGLQLWLDADDASTVTVATDLVSAWASKHGGAGRDYSQGTAGNRPTYTGAEINGRQAIDFDGVDNFLTVADFSAVTAGDHTIIIVCDADTLAGAGDGDTIADWLTGRVAVAIDDPLGVGSDVGFLENVNWRTAGTAITGPQVLHWQLVAPTSGAIWRNGTLLGGGLTYPQLGLGGSGWIGSALNGAARFFDGRIGEIVVYSPALSDAAMLNVVGALRQKWSI